MKKLSFLFTVFCFSAAAQNEWTPATNVIGSNIYRTGNVAIGAGMSAAPILPFSVRAGTALGTKIAFGNNVIQGTYATGTSVLEITSPTNTNETYLSLLTGIGTSNSSFSMGISQFGANFYSSKGSAGTARPILFYTDGGTGLTERLKINTNGTVGIGLPPSYPAGYNLYVTEGILTEKVKVAIRTSTAWSDFVFDANYKLMSLQELDNYIKKNKHLPNIPTAEEVVKDGIDVATMDAKLLQKIEELTLHIIELEKRIHQLEKR
jgi:trimeric autotransporter adhesin